MLTLNRTVPSAVTLVLTHVENTVGAGEIFDISINGGTSTITFNYDTAAERDDASPLTTAGNMVEGMVLRDLGAWDGEYELYTITLAGTNLTETATTIDENGTLIYSASNSITFELSGTGRLIGHNPVEAGIASIVVESQGEEGIIEIGASSPGLLTPEKIEIKVE